LPMSKKRIKGLLNFLLKLLLLLQQQFLLS
jgi:hypothetical protein